MTAKIEAYCQTCGKFIPEPNMAYGISPEALCRCCKHDRIAAHAPKQPEWEAKEKALRELANEWASFSWAPFMNPAARLKAILNTPAAGWKEGV